MNQNHLTISFPLKSPTDGTALAQELLPLMPDFAKAQDAVGTVHYSRFVNIGGKSLLFLADIDGEVEELIGGLAKSAGPVFDAIFGHVENPPRTPVASDVETFTKWMKNHYVRPLLGYSALENTPVQDIKSFAAAAGVRGSGEEHPLLMSVPLKSTLKEFVLEEVVLRATKAVMVKGANSIGTLHFAHFVHLDNKQLGFFTIFDGTFDKYIEDFTEKMGPVFDTLYSYSTDPPKAPVAKNPEAFLKWSVTHNLAPIGLYSAYPGLSVLDIRSLVADRKAAAAH